MSKPIDAAHVVLSAITGQGTIDQVIIGSDVAPPAQTLSGDAPIPTGERVLKHGPDDHRHDDDRQR